MTGCSLYPQYAQQGAKKEDTDFVYYKLEGGQWKIKVEGARYREGTTEKGAQQGCKISVGQKNGNLEEGF